MSRKRSWTLSLKGAGLAILTGAVLALPFLGLRPASADSGVASLDQGSRTTDRVRNNNTAPAADLSVSKSPSRISIKVDIGKGRRKDQHSYGSFEDAWQNYGDDNSDWYNSGDLQVLDFESYGTSRERMIDARKAWYLENADWHDGPYADYPYLAFRDADTAQHWQRELGGTLVDFETVIGGAQIHVRYSKGDPGYGYGNGHDYESCRRDWDNNGGDGRDNNHGDGYDNGRDRDRDGDDKHWRDNYQWRHRNRHRRHRD